MTKDAQRREKILNGKLVKTIIAICLPLFVYNFINAAFSLLDASIVSSINPMSVSAVSTIGQIKRLLSTMGVGLSAGGAILVARAFGAKETYRARKYANVMVAMSIVVILLLVGIAVPLAVPIMKISGVPDELIAIGTGYFIVQIFDLGFMFINSVFIGLQKAKGSTLFILIMNLVIIIVKVSLTAVFVFVLKVDNIIWVAIATMIGQMLLFIIAFIVMTNKNFIFRITIKGLSLKKKYVKPILIMALPIFLGKFIFSFGKVSVNAMSKSYGPLVVGALGVSDALSGIITSPVNAFEEAESTIISQNIGNKNIKRALMVFSRSLIIALTFAVFGFIMVRFVLQDWLINLFALSNETEDVVLFKELIRSIFYYGSWSIIALAVNTTVLGALYGFGQTKISMIVNISRAFIFRIPILWYLQTFRKDMGVESVGISMGLSNIGITIMSVVFFLIFLRKIKKYGYNGIDVNNNIILERAVVNEEVAFE